MDVDENLINNFANALRNHHAKRTASLYENRNQSSSGVEKYEIKDVITGVAKQLKAIQQADSVKRQPSSKGIPTLVKKSNFLPMHMVPVEQPLKKIQSHKFETQCLLDTQLINIIEDAEAIIDAENGITQEFETTFCHKDVNNCHNTTVDGELLNIVQEPNLLQEAYFEDSECEFNIQDNLSQSGSDITNLQLHNCNMSDNARVEYSKDVEKGMTQEFNITFCHKDQDDNVKEKDMKHDSYYIQQKNGSCELLENDNDNIQKNNHIVTDYDSIVCTKLFEKTIGQPDLFDAKILSPIEEKSSNITIKHFEPKSEEKQSKIKDVCDNFDTQSNFYYDTCEDDTNDYSQNELISNSNFKVEEPKSPILNKTQTKEKANTPLPLIFQLESFEIFESFALPIIEKHDYEIAKRVINSEILNRELFIHTHAESVLSDRDKNTQKRIPILKCNKKTESCKVICKDNRVTMNKDSMLFSSDEEDVTFQNSFDSESEILDKSMYVGFQTASNKCIQISTNSYSKAKHIFHNITNIERENLSGGSFVDVVDNSNKTNASKDDHYNVNVAMNSTEDDNTTDSNGELLKQHINVFHNNYRLPNNDDKLKNNVKLQVDDISNLQLHDCGIADIKRVKLSKEENTQEERIRNAEVDQLSGVAKTTDNKCENFTEYLQIDNHILEEFNKDLIPDINKQHPEASDIIDIDNSDTLASKAEKRSFESLNSLHLLTSSGCAANLLYDINLNVMLDNKKNETQKIVEINKADNIKSFMNQSELHPACHLESNSMLQGFKTASNKVVEISKHALNKTKNIFENINNINENLEEKPYYSIYDTASNGAFEGFMTACNKPVIISDSAFTKTKKILQDIDKNKEIYDCDFKVPASDTVVKSSNAHQGLATASYKRVKICERALAKPKKKFQYTKTESNENINDNGSKIPAYTTASYSFFDGFKTANNKTIPISEKQLANCKDIFQDIFDTKATKVEFNNIINKSSISVADSMTAKPLSGFRTASNKSVKVSKESLSKTKKIFQDIDIKRHKKYNPVCDDLETILKDNAIVNISQNPICQGFKTASNMPLGISAEALAKSKKIFQGIDIESHEENKVINDDFENIIKEKQPYPIASIFHNNICQIIKTPNNISGKISEEALSKMKRIFQDIDIEDHKESKVICDDSANILKEKQLNYTEAQKAMYQGFKTASNEPVKISAHALAKSKIILENMDIDCKGKQINDIHRTLKKGFEDIDICVDIDDKLKENQPLVNRTKNAILCHRFKTANNKPVETSAHALAETRTVFKNMYMDCEGNKITGEVIEKKIELPIQSRHRFIGFNTASNKTVKISEDALLKSKQLFGTADAGLKNAVCTFKNSSNLDPNDNKSAIDFKIKPTRHTHIDSEEGLKKYGNIFNDKDSSKSLKAGAISKLNQDAAISENVGLEDFNTEVIKDFEETVYTEDFVKNETPRSKRSGSPILSYPKAKKIRKFETPIMTKKFVAPIRSKSTIKTDTNNLYKFDETYKKITKYSLKYVKEIEKLNNVQNVDPYILNLKFDKLLDFEFTGNRNDINNDKWMTDKIKKLFIDSVNKRIIPDGWIENHLKLIIWKLLSYEIRFPVVMKNVCSVKNVLEQLNYRYKRELYNVERPALRKILEKDEVSTKRMILCVAGMLVDGVNISSVTNETQNIELLLTDGWYTIKATTDRMIDRLVCDGKIGMGTKLAIHGAELLNCDQGIAPWEDTSSVRLKISGNSTRRAKWDARLGFHGNGAILTRLSAVKPEGGKISHLRTLVTRVYPTLYIEKFPDGSTLTRSERLENIHQMKYETERQIQMEKLYEELERFSDQESQDSEGQCLEDIEMDSGSQISRLMKKSKDRDEFRANLTSSQAHLLQQHTLKQNDRLVQALQDKFQELVKQRGLDAPRNVVPLVKIRVADVDTGGVTKAMTTIWKPNETIQEMLTEGTWIDLYNVVPTSVRYSELQISAGRQSVFRRAKSKENDTLKTLARTLKRQCFTTKDLQNPSMNTDYNEVDTVGLIFLIQPQTKEFETKSQPFQNVYLTDENKNIICVNFWGGIKKLGFQNVLDTGQVVTCVNLQKRAGNTRKNIPQYRATEFSYFTRISKIDSVRKMADDLTAKFCTLDKQRFIDDCVSLKNNYHNMKCANTENVSPYRLNSSDYNVYKNKVFIESPLVNSTDLNLSGLDFESTFKQTETQDLSPQMLIRKRKVNEKIVKLKMYGEPPPLSTIHVINKSSNTIKAFKSPFSKNDISASSSVLPRNYEEYNTIFNLDNSNQNNKECKDCVTKLPQDRVECKSGVTNSDALPKSDGNKIDSSPILNRTYLKRASINPVKLNFSNAIETSITDPFAEDFDGSPPLSLDVNFVT